MKLPIGKKEKKTEAGVSPSSALVHEDGRRDIPKTKTDIVTVDDAGVIRIGKTKYAVDLYRATRPDKSLKEEAKTLPHIGKADTWTLYSKVPTGRIAYGSPGIGHKRGMLPLAESISTGLLGENWIVIITLDGGRYWVAEKKDGQIVNDEIFDDEAVAKNQVAGEKPSKERPIVAPKLWQIEGATETTLPNLIGDKVPALKRFTFLQNHGLRLGLLIFVAGVGFGTHTYFQAQEAQRVAEERDLAERRKNRVMVNDADFPWFEAPSTAAFLQACGRMMNDSVRSLPGWIPQSPVCQYASGSVVVTQTYSREADGRIAWLRETYAGAPGTVSLDPAGNQGTYSVSEALVGSKDGFDRNSPWTEANIASKLRERFQNVGLQPQFLEDVSRVQPGRGAEVPVFNSHGMTISLPFFPSEVVQLMEDVPATVPENLIWDINTNNWNLRVRIHHPAILPLGAI